MGPPGLALNLYYLGRTFQEMGLVAEALQAWNRCAIIDKTALSPLLDSVFLHLNLGSLSNARDLRDRILATKDLDEQLSNEERLSLQSV